jgi:transcriptional regulator with XRE-family HTH domain
MLTMTPRAFREKKGLNLLQMAERLGVAGENPSRTYQRWETGERPVPLPVVAAFEKMSAGRVRASDWPQAHPERAAS